MKKTKGHDPGEIDKRPAKRYMVYIDNTYYGETTAVSPEKAANNIRYQIYRENSSWLDVPPIEDFDCVEV